MWAAGNGHLETVDLLLKNGGDVNIGDGIDFLPLHHAAGGNHTEVVKFLVKKGSDLLARTCDDETVLHLATRLDLVSFLVEQGADIHARDDEGKPRCTSLLKKANMTQLAIF